MDYKNYIKVNEDDDVISSFQGWQIEKFDGTEIFVGESNDRHFNLDLLDFESGLHKLQWSGSAIIEKDISAEKAIVLQRNNIKSQLVQSDQNILRAIEDVIEALDAKNILKKTELPVEVQEKVTMRKLLREQLAELE